MRERSEKVESPGTYAALPCSGGYHLVRGGMPLHDVVETNCKNGSTTENQGADVKYTG